MPPKQAIAVIGIACRYPGAQTPLQLWENILSRRRQFRRFPTCRMSPADYYHPDKKVADKTYGMRGAFIDGYTFDWVKRRIPKTTFLSTDIAHWLALDVALAAVHDASFTKENIPGKRTGVLVGNSLTGEQTRANTMRLRWPYVRKALWSAARERRLDDSAISEIETALESYYKSAFPPVTEDTLAGGLSNTIAGRICNALDLDGGGYTVDGACSSSLLAVTTAARGLAQHDIDLALAGGIDISLDPFELVGFAKTGALTPKDMTVYDRGGCGFIPGEGAGFVVLKRLDDAQRDNNYVYAILHGWGISSDGGGTGITAPSSLGQSKALRRAYDQAPYDMKSLDFIEGHGTGTTVGDQVELKGIVQAMEQGDATEARSCGVTSLKSIIGHTKAAAGIGGFIKTVMAVNRRVIPPTAACREPHSIFDKEATTLFPVQHGKTLASDTTVRAGISAMGFGGINCHTTVASGDQPSSKLVSKLPENALFVSYQENEVFVLDASNFQELRNKCKLLAKEVELISLAEMTDLASHLWGQITNDKMRIAIVAAEPLELLNALKSMYTNPKQECPPSGKMTHDPVHKIWLSNQTQKPVIAMLFCGQGAQQLNMAAVLINRFKWATDLLKEADKTCADIGTSQISKLIIKHTELSENQKHLAKWQKDLSQTEHSQPAICICSLLWYKFLAKLGIEPDLTAGHSLGELTAFYAAGAFDEKILIEFAAIRGQAMRAKDNSRGSMVSLRCSQEEAKKIISSVEGYIVLANINSPSQMILSGENDAIEQAITNAAAKEIKSFKLPVSNAFHSKMASSAADTIKDLSFLQKSPNTLKTKLFSSTSGQQINPKIQLNEHFSKQTLSKVDFIKTIKNMAKQCDLFLEVGPGRILTGLTNEITRAKGPKCLPIETEAESSLDLNRMVAELFTRGANITGKALYEGRLVRPYVSPQQRIFIENQCEYHFADVPKQRISSGSGDFEQLLTTLTRMSNEELSSYLLDRGPFLAKVIRADQKYSVSPKNTDGVLPIPQISNTKEKILGKPIIEESTSQAEDILKEIIQKHTGFPLEAISEDSHLLDDLNLDSIKAGDVIAEFAIKCGNAGKIEPGEFTNATVSQILKAIKELKPQGITERKTSISAILFDQIEELTGFPKESLKVEMRLLDDLNLDSIKAGDLLAQTSILLKNTPSIEAIDLTNATLAEIIEAFTSAPVQSQDIATQPSDLYVLDTLLHQTAEVSGYPLESLTPNSLVAEDLNFSEEMLQNLIIRMGAELDIETHVDLAPLMHRSLAQISDVLNRIVKSSKAKQQDLEGNKEPWVRDFTVKLYEEALPPLPKWWGKRQEDSWEQLNWLILTDHKKDELPLALQEKLRQSGAQSKVHTFTEAKQKKHLQNSAFSHITAILPAFNSGPTEIYRIQQIINRLRSIVSPAPASQAPRRRTTVTYIQFGGGYFGMEGEYAHLEQCGARALAASLHLERADLRVRVLDFSTTVDNKIFAEKVLAETNTPQAFSAVGYDYKLNRRVFLAQVSIPASYKHRSIEWTENDTILVTGGARGITALCALRVAKESRVKMALVGSSPLPNNKQPSKSADEINAILKKYKELGLKAQYYSCDVTSETAVKDLFLEISETLGPITGVIHGAGRNIPRLVNHLSSKDIEEEIFPKIAGAVNILQQCRKSPPKLIIGLTSIIGITGMPGNAWYGFSNEALDILLREFSTNNPETQTQSVAFSIWRDEGMGAKMGSVEALQQKGIDAIPTQEGISRFARVFINDPAAHQIIISARLGGLDTWKFNVPETPDYRYLETLHNFTPGVESIFSAHLTLPTDPYLKDHYFNGSYLMPTVFGLEAMAQAVTHATGKQLPEQLIITDILLKRPITVDPKDGADITITATISENTDEGDSTIIKATLAKGINEHKRTCFSATFELNSPIAFIDDSIKTPSPPLPINPETDLYRKNLLFQGPLFQRIAKVFTINDSDEKAYAIFQTSRLPTLESAKAAFPEEKEPLLVLGDPFFRDSLLQSAALLIPQDTSLPIKINKIQIKTKDCNHGQKIKAMVSLDFIENSIIRNQVFSVDPVGNPVEQLADYELKVLAHHDEYPKVYDLLCPDERDTVYLQTLLQTISSKCNLSLPIASISYQPGIHTFPKEKRRKLELPQLLKTATKATSDHSGDAIEVDICWSKEGKPLINNSDFGISFSHDDRLCLCVAGLGEQGCDTAPVNKRSREQWLALLGSHGRLLDQLIENGHSLDKSGTRIWSALEALKKTGHKDYSLISFEKHDSSSIVFKNTHIQVITISITFTWGPERIIAITAKPKKTEHIIPSAQTKRTDYNELLGLKHIEVHDGGGPQGQLAFVQRFPVTFRPSAMLNRTVYFSKYIDWIGEVRETSVWPVLHQLSEQFASGKWGQVTNHTTLQVVGEATTGDMLEVLVWASELSGPSNSTINLTFDFRKLSDDGQIERIATVVQQTSWVKIIGPGVVRPEPFSSFYDSFIKKLLPKNSSQTLAPLKKQLSSISKETAEEKFIKKNKAPFTHHVLYEEAFNTGLDCANLVGNIYFANYFTWQGRVRDCLFHNLAPEYFKGTGEEGELLCLNSSVYNLREAMPFDRIIVSLYLESITASSVNLYFEYFKEEDGKRLKLAHGKQQAAWVKKVKKEGKTVLKTFPEKIINALVRS